MYHESKIFTITQEECRLEILSRHILLLKVDRFEGYLHHNKMDGMVNNYLSSCEF